MRAAIRPTVGELTETDLMDHQVEMLPSRAALSGLINIVNITGINIALAINAGSFGTVATAHALQGVGYVG